MAKTTVARVLNDKPHVKPALRARVLAAATELGYNPAVHDVARRLAYRKTGRRLLHRTIGLLINDEVYRINYHARLHKGIVEEVTAQHYILLSVLFAKNDPHPAIALDRILMHGVDGLIVQPGGDLAARVQEQAQQRQHTHGCPYVISLSLDPEVDGVYADERQGAYDAVQALLALGHRFFLHFITYPFLENIHLQNRLAGVRQALLEAGLNSEAHLHLFRLPEQPFSWATPESLSVDYAMIPPDSLQGHPLVGYLRAHPRITALLAYNDACAIHAWRTLAAVGKHIPRDYSLVGFDDTDPVRDSAGQNLLSSVQLPLEEIGRRVVRLIIQQIERQQTETVQQIVPTAYMQRASVGPAREHR